MTYLDKMYITCKLLRFKKAYSNEKKLLINSNFFYRFTTITLKILTNTNTFNASFLVNVVFLKNVLTCPNWLKINNG